jgi:phosphatidate cytidylyltransferase
VLGNDDLAKFKQVLKRGFIMFLTRLISTLVLGTLVIWGILVASEATFQLVTTILMLFVAWEWACLLPARTYFNKISYVLLMLAVFSVTAFLMMDYAIYILAIGVVWWLISILFLVHFERNDSQAHRMYLNAILGLVAIIPCWVALNVLRSQPQGAKLILLFLLMLWATDIGAYLVGSRFGRTRFAPKLSPKKSLEGAAGGLGLMLVVAIGGIIWLHIPAMHWVSYFLAAFALFIFSVIGDLFESLLKRKAGVKDSGNLIPGHGGMLDRLDSMLAAAPIYTVAILMAHLAR